MSSQYLQGLGQLSLIELGTLIIKFDESCIHPETCDFISNIKIKSKSNIPYHTGQSSAKLPVTKLLSHSVTWSLGHSSTLLEDDI